MSARRAPASRLAAPGPLTAFVLHQYDWSESSLIVELFSRERGRLVVVAKGAKRPTSNFRSVLLPFQCLQLSLGRAPADDRSEIHALRAVEALGWQGGITRSATALFAGFYLNELLLKLLPREDAHPELFARYAGTLPLLSSGDAPLAQAALRAFELALLRELGWLPELHTETATLAPLASDSHYDLKAESGMVAVAEPAGLKGAQWLQLEAALTHADPAVLSRCVLPMATALRGALRQVLDYHLPAASLRTRDVLRSTRTLHPR